MSQKFLLLIVVIAISLIITIVAIYISTFGVIRSFDQSIWGAFGDYFGGILNPVFALCAFLGVLWSLDVQIKQLKQISVDKQGEEILLVVKDIDARIVELLGTKVGTVDKEKVFIHHMVAESERGVGVLGSSDAYTQFITAVRQPGSMLEAPTRELRDQVVTMHSFLVRYPQSQNGHFAPIVEYYIRKTSRVVQMLSEVGELPQAVCSLFSITQQANS